MWQAVHLLIAARSDCRDEPAVSLDSLHQTMMPGGPVGLQRGRERALEVRRAPADLVDVGQRAPVEQTPSPGETQLLGLEPGGGDVHHDLLEGRRLLGLSLGVQCDLLAKLPGVGGAGPGARAGSGSAA